MLHYTHACAHTRTHTRTHTRPQIDADTTASTLLSLFLPHLRLTACGTKAQFNAGGGGAFPIHTDSEEGLDGRRVRACACPRA